MRHLVRSVALLLLLFGAVPPASADPCVEQCQGVGSCVSPVNCTIETNCEVPVGTRLDLCGGDLLVKTEKRVRATAAGDQPGFLDIAAGSVVLEPKAVLDAVPVEGLGGEVRILSVGDVVLGASSLVDVKASVQGGAVSIESQGGDVQALGLIRADDSDGNGSVFLGAQVGAVTVAGAGINVSSGDDGFGSSVEISAATDVSIAAPINLRGGDGGGLDVNAGGSIESTASGTIDANARGPGFFGGSLGLFAGGSVRLAGTISAEGGPGSEDDGGGVGGDVSISAESGSVELAATADIELRGTGPDGDGGSLDIEAGADVTVWGDVLAGVDGGGFGGDITMSAGARASFASKLDVTAKALRFEGQVLGGSGGIIDVFSVESLDVVEPAALLADGLDGAGGGLTLLQSCTLDVRRDATVSAKGAGPFSDAENQLRASGPMTIHGRLLAGNRNLLEYRDTPPAIQRPPAEIDPDEVVMQNLALPACAPPPTTSTTVVPSSTTSTSIVATTTTTAAPVTSTTATTTTVPASGSTTSSSLATPTTSPTTTSPTTTAPSTTTTLPTSCLDQPLEGLDDIECNVDVLAELLASEPTDALGGPRSARALTNKIAQARRLITLAREKTNPMPTLRRAKKQLKRLRNLAQRGTRRGRITSEVGDRLLLLASEASAAIDQLRATAGPTARR